MKFHTLNGIDNILFGIITLHFLSLFKTVNNRKLFSLKGTCFLLVTGYYLFSFLFNVCIHDPIELAVMKG